MKTPCSHNNNQLWRCHVVIILPSRRYPGVCPDHNSRGQTREFSHHSMFWGPLHNNNVFIDIISDA